MSARISLKKTGKKGQPYYRVVVLDRSKSRDTEVLEDLGFYDPKPDPRDVRIDKERAYEWLKKGAEPSDTVRDIFSQEGLMEKLHEEKYG